jgi:hypothetical protein
MGPLGPMGRPANGGPYSPKTRPTHGFPWVGLTPEDPALVSDLLGQLIFSAATYAEYNIKVADYKVVKEAYNKAIPGWEKKQEQAYIIILSKYRYNNYQKIKTLNRVYKMLDILQKERSINTGKLIELIIKFYIFIFADYKNITDFSS